MKTLNQAIRIYIL